MGSFSQASWVFSTRGALAALPLLLVPLVLGFSTPRTGPDPDHIDYSRPSAENKTCLWEGFSQGLCPQGHLRNASYP